MQDKKYIQNQSRFHDRKDIAVLLINFGGPDSLHSVKPFLYNLFSDPTVINFPFANLYRKPLAWLIANLRNKASGEMYKKIGTISPQISITFLQKEKLQELFKKNNLKINVFIGFRYCKPFITDVLDEIKNLNYKKVIALPLYPQYSYTTTGSVQLVVNEWLKKTRAGEKEKARKEDLELLLIKDWHKDEDYIQSFASLIKNTLENMDLRSTEIIFSAHSIPLFNIKNGDPYKVMINETAQEIIRKLSWKKRWRIAYQSKLGPVKWLEPGTDLAIKEIAKKNPNANILVVPISFVSEHVETIYEIGILYKDIAKKYGIKKFVRLPALNIDKYLIQALYNQVNRVLEKCNNYNEVLTNWSKC